MKNHRFSKFNGKCSNSISTSRQRYIYPSNIFTHATAADHVELIIRPVLPFLLSVRHPPVANSNVKGYIDGVEVCMFSCPAEKPLWLNNGCSSVN